MPKARKLPAAVRQALAKGASIPQVGELVSHFVALAGGTQTLAKMMLEEFLAAKAGSIIRQRILDTILRLASGLNSEMGNVDDMDLLATEDLERELERLVKEMPEGAPEEAATP